MSDKELKQVLQEIKDKCRDSMNCRGCHFYVYDGCVLNNVPGDWDLDKIDKADRDKWSILYDWLTDIRSAFIPVNAADPADYTARKIRYDLIDEIIVYMSELDEEEDDET